MFDSEVNARLEDYYRGMRGGEAAKIDYATFGRKWCVEFVSTKPVGNPFWAGYRATLDDIPVGDDED